MNDIDPTQTVTPCSNCGASTNNTFGRCGRCQCYDQMCTEDLISELGKRDARIPFLLNQVKERGLQRDSAKQNYHSQESAFAAESEARKAAEEIAESKSDALCELHQAHEKYIKGIRDRLGIVVGQPFIETLVGTKEERDTALANLDACRRDSERMDWLIKQGPPGAAEDIGLNQETWDAAYSVDTEDIPDKNGADKYCVRAAIDAESA